MTQHDLPLGADRLIDAPGGTGDEAALATASLGQETREDILEEIRQLVTDLRDATQDGRGLARRYAEVLQNVVDEYCVEFEKRAQAALEKLDRLA
jgi:signal transduction histidine kinase